MHACPLLQSITVQVCAASDTELCFTSMLQLQANHWCGLLSETDSAARRQSSGATGRTACTQPQRCSCLCPAMAASSCSSAAAKCACSAPCDSIPPSAYTLPLRCLVSCSECQQKTLPRGSPSHAPHACRVAMGHRGPDHRQQDAGQLHLWCPSCHTCVRHHKSPGRWPWLSCLMWGQQAEPTSAGRACAGWSVIAQHEHIVQRLTGWRACRPTDRCPGLRWQHLMQHVLHLWMFLPAGSRALGQQAALARAPAAPGSCLLVP